MVYIYCVEPLISVVVEFILRIYRIYSQSSLSCFRFNSYRFGCNSRRLGCSSCFSCSFSWGGSLLWLFFLGSFNGLVWSFGGFSDFFQFFSFLGSPSIVKFFVFFCQSNRFFPSFNFVFLLYSLSSESGFSDKSLDFGGFESIGGIGILFTFEGSSNGVLFYKCAWAWESLFVFSFLDSIEFSDSGSSLGS